MRQMKSQQPVRVIAVTSGKGGVGKSNVTVNLAVTLAQGGESVMVMDADMGLANIDVLLGLSPGLNMSHVVNGECSLEETIIEGPAGIKIVPASSGVASMSDLTPAQNAGVIRSFSELTLPVDTLLIDTAAGISDSVVSYIRAAREVIVVVCDEPASITDAYAMVKVMNRDYGVERFHVLANQAQSVQQGRELFNKLARVSQKFLDVTLDYLGSVPYDDCLKKAVQKQKSVVEAFPRSPSALAFKQLAKKTLQWPTPTSMEGHLEFFIERLVSYSAQEERL
ncbi:MAG: MinD/ParA family protein [Gammaproteobacteria bacterium]|nr:MinD/ParA family protein [Gammaproteobacteria bacterium]MDH3450120.1 MinD/ParA family protein [Gammaproteobacteria bacterium]